MSKSTEHGRRLVYERMGDSRKIVAEIEGSYAYTAVTVDALYAGWKNWGKEGLLDIPLDTISTINIQTLPGCLRMTVVIAGQHPFRADLFSVLIGGASPNPSPSVDFKKNQGEELKAFVKRVMELRAQAKTPRSQQPTLSIPEQIKQLAELRDQGILSQEEFQAKKNDLLSRM